MELELLNLLLVLLAAWVGGALATKIGYPAILGEITAGILLGPALFNFIGPSETTAVLAEVGILLMMLYIGMEIDFRELGKASWAGLLAAVGGFAVPFAAGYYTVIAFGGTEMGALFVAIAVGVTSLATKSRILVDLKLLNTRIAHVLMAGALISDTLALVIFAGILGFADAGTINITEIGIVAGKAILFFIVTAVLGIYIIPYLGKKLEQAGFNNRTLFFTLMLIIGVGFAELAELAGLHHILGAFLAGLFLRDSVFNRKLSIELRKIFYDVSIGFLAPIFFVTAGFLVTFDVFFTDLGLLVTILLVATIGKIAGTALFYLPSGYGWREGLTVGAGMNGRGAVEIIIAGIALRMGFISAEIFSILVFMAIFTTATVPILLTWTTNWLRSRGELVLSDEKKKGYLMLGAGRLSLYIAQKFRERKIPVTLIDSNNLQCQKAQRLKLKCINGNGLKEEVMAEAGAGEARTFISITHNSEINVLAAQQASDIFAIPHLHVLLTQSEEGANVSFLEPMSATTIFAQMVDLDEWESMLKNKTAQEHTIDVTEEISARDFLKNLREKEGEILPLFYFDQEDDIFIYHYGAELQENFKVMYLKGQEQTPEKSSQT